MIYLLADPLLIYLQLPEPGYEAVKKFTQRLSQWNQILREYDVRLSMTKACRVAIGKTLQHKFNRETLNEVCQRYDFQFSSNEIMNAASPFINSLLVDEELDKLLDSIHFPPEPYYEAPPEKLHPKNYSERLASQHLQEAFYEMLRQVARIRAGQVPMAKEFENVAVLTIFEGNDSWVTEHLEQVFVIVGWDSSSNPPQKRVVEALPVVNVDRPNTEILNANRRRNFRSVLHAVEEAVKANPEKLFLSSQGARIIKKYDFDDRVKIYTCIDGLIRIWLPVYQQSGQDAANKAFLSEYGCEVASSYGEATLRNPNLMGQFAVTTDVPSETEFAVRHIKLSDEGGEYRVHFQEYEKPNKEIGIVLGWIGRHPRVASEI